MSEPKVLTIQRSKWRRGRKGSTYLLDTAGWMCCLGFDALACGIPTERILLKETPLAAFPYFDPIPEHYADGRMVFRDVFDGGDSLVRNHTDVVRAAMEHNDDSALTEPERERLVREDLMALGWSDVEFVD